jgi:hypothetical protein
MMRTMNEAEWAHLQPLVDALVAAGNETRDGGFRPNQGGTDCYMRDPLDYDVLRPLVAQDPHRDRISMGDDRLDCLHCWAGIGGAKYLKAVSGLRPFWPAGGPNRGGWWQRLRRLGGR